jgi:hypothetical protein
MMSMKLFLSSTPEVLHLDRISTSKFGTWEIDRQKWTPWSTVVLELEDFWLYQRRWNRSPAGA